jgi:general stress protein 26
LARTTKAGRNDRVLQRLAAAGVITVAGKGPIDQRVLRLTDAGRRDTSWFPSSRKSAVTRRFVARDAR